MVLTARAAYINILTELVKEESPTLYLEDYLYYFNKAISEYMKSRYEMYETNQQLADDLIAWKKEYKTQSLNTPIANIFKPVTVGGKIVKTEVYRHVLGCMIDATVTSPVIRCSQAAFSTATYKVTRMSSEIKVGMLDNAYLKPEFYRPYYELINNNIKINVGTTDAKRVAVKDIVIEYLCQPALVDLTEEQIEEEADTSQVLEFSQDVGEEITKVALKLILERGSNPRLQSHTVVNQSISDINTGMKGGR
jgi:hypothetical protein